MRAKLTAAVRSLSVARSTLSSSSSTYCEHIIPHCISKPLNLKPSMWHLLTYPSKHPSRRWQPRAQQQLAMVRHVHWVCKEPYQNTQRSRRINIITNFLDYCWHELLHAPSACTISHYVSAYQPSKCGHITITIQYVHCMVMQGLNRVPQVSRWLRSLPSRLLSFSLNR